MLIVYDRRVECLLYKMFIRPFNGGVGFFLLTNLLTTYYREVRFNGIFTRSIVDTYLQVYIKIITAAAGRENMKEPIEKPLMIKVWNRRRSVFL